MIGVVDIDGVLARNWERADLIYQDPPDWKTFFERCGEDTVMRGMLGLLNCTDLDCFIVLLTSRPDWNRQETEKWLKAVGVPYNQLITQSRKTAGIPASEWKVTQLLEIEEKMGVEVDFVIEDDPSVFVAMLKEGFPVVPIYSAYYDKKDDPPYPNYQEMGEAVRIGDEKRSCVKPV